MLTAVYIVAALYVLDLLIDLYWRLRMATPEMTALQANIAAAQAGLAAVQTKVAGLQTQITTIQGQLANTDNPADVQKASDDVKAIADQLAKLGQ